MIRRLYIPNPFETRDHTKWGELGGPSLSHTVARSDQTIADCCSQTSKLSREKRHKKDDSLVPSKIGLFLVWSGYMFCEEMAKKFSKRRDLIEHQANKKKLRKRKFRNIEQTSFAAGFRNNERYHDFEFSNRNSLSVQIVGASIYSSLCCYHFELENHYYFYQNTLW